MSRIQSHILRVLFPVLALISVSAKAQVVTDPVVDYNSPKKYIIAGVTVEGNTRFDDEQIISSTGLREGMEVVVPSSDLSAILQRLWNQEKFDDIQFSIDSLTPKRDSAYFKITVRERPRMSAITFSGVKTSEQKDLVERMNIRRGNEFSEYLQIASKDIITKYFTEKGYLKTKVEIETKKDTIIPNAIQVNFAIDRGDKIKIKTINFEGNDHVKEFKLARSMKKTKSAKFYNFFSTKKFNEKEYANDKKNLISAFNEAGFRDARIVKDSIYYVEPDRLGIDFVVDEGDRYYFRNIIWTGNSVYDSDALNEVLGIMPGDVYDLVTLQNKLFGGGKDNDLDVSKLYRDNGFLFFNVTPVELNIQNDSVDVELRISEGKQATLNNIVINGNDLTSEKVIRRQVMTRPGYLFSQSDFERSIREIASMGQFEPEAIADPNTGYSILPNPMNNTVDIVYNVTEKPSSQLELSGGWGGGRRGTFIATVGVSFNNFSTHRMFDKSAWRPVPLGDAQNLSLRFQTNGKYYTALTASFMEPWLFGKKPTSLSLSLYYTRQTSSNIYLNILNNDRRMDIFGFSASLGKRLKWPDSYFILYNGLSWQTYDLKNWYSNYFIFDDGISHNINYSLSLSRNSTDQEIYPRQGSDFSFSVQLTPPFSLFRKKDLGQLDEFGNPISVKSWRDINYDNWTSSQRYKWIEYHKWKFSGATYLKLAGDLVLMTRAQFGYLGYYNRNWGYSPFEGFLVGGDGMSGYYNYGSEMIALRGYANLSLTPMQATPYNSNGTAYAGNLYDKFTVELRYPLIMEPSSTVFGLLFLEGGNCWADIRDFNPFQMKRSAGVGARIYLPMIGLIGVDWGYGFDDSTNGKSQFHFMLGQQF